MTTSGFTDIFPQADFMIDVRVDTVRINPCSSSASTMPGVQKSDGYTLFLHFNPTATSPTMNQRIHSKMNQMDHFVPHHQDKAGEDSTIILYLYTYVTLIAALYRVVN